MTAPGVEATARCYMCRRQVAVELVTIAAGVGPRCVDREECRSFARSGSTERADLRADVERLRKVAEAALRVYRAWDEDRHYVNKMFALGRELRDAGYALRKKAALPAGEDGRDG